MKKVFLPLSCPAELSGDGARTSLPRRSAHNRYHLLCGVEALSIRRNPWKVKSGFSALPWAPRNRADLLPASLLAAVTAQLRSGGVRVCAGSNA